MRNLEADSDLLRRCLERSIARIHGRSTDIVAIRSRKLAASTSYPCDILSIQLAHGGRLTIFRKDLGSSQLPKDEMGQRRERELRVYRDLLASAGLGTAGYYGSVWNESRGRFWLLLEYIEGRLLRDCAVEHWVAAAAWLGQMHARFAQHAGTFAGLDFLLRHEAEYFQAKADLALRAVSQKDRHLAGRLVRIIRDYHRLAHVMASQPSTLVHGSFRPQNILVTGREALGICPVDWELAALGSPLLDLAFISDGFAPPRLDLFYDAYRERAAAPDIPMPDRQEMAYIVNCFRLHKVIKSLGESAAWQFPISVVAKLVDLGEEIQRLVA